MILTINGQQVALKKGASIEYVSENRIFTDADDYSMEIELPLAGCSQNLAVFGMLTRKDVDAETIYYDAVLQDTNFYKRGAVVITEITNEYVKVQFLEKRSYQNFFPRFDEKYINELDLGEWPSLTPSNTTPQQMWSRWQDYTALPWVNNSTGVMQNCVKWNSSQNRYEWKTEGDNDDDLDYSKGFSFQPNLLWLTKKICDALGYTYDFSMWENSIYKYLIVMNTTPYVWSSGKWATALPHWTINEFFMELENLLLYEFDIDHKKGHINCSRTQENVESAGDVLIEQVVDEFSVEVDTEDEDDYKAMLNRGYANGGHRLDNFYSCEWYIHRLTKPDGTVKCTEYETLAQLLAHRLKQDCISDNTEPRGSNLYPGGKWGLHHAQDVDTYFVVEVVERIEYRTQGGNVFETWGNVCRLVPVNRFGNLILDSENRDNIEELRINNRAYGQGVERTSFTNIDRKKKYSFSFLAKEIPNVRSTFFIDGKKYLCAKIVATFSEDGLSELMKGEFYKIQ